MARSAAAEALWGVARRPLLRGHRRPGGSPGPCEAPDRGLDAGGRAPDLPRAPSLVGRQPELTDRQRAGGATPRPVLPRLSVFAARFAVTASRPAGPVMRRS